MRGIEALRGSWGVADLGGMRAIPGGSRSGVVSDFLSKLPVRLIVRNEWLLAGFPSNCSVSSVFLWKGA